MPVCSLFSGLHRTIRHRFLLALVALVSLVSLAPAAYADDFDSQWWTLLTFNARFRSGLRAYAEVQPRLGNNYTEFTQLIVRPAVGYQVNKNLSLWMGYGWTPTLAPDYNDEHRVFQQALFENQYTGFEMINRSRLEQRSIEGAGGLSWRLRHQIRFVKPLEGTKRLSLVGMNELFWNLNSTPNGPQSGFDQTRPYLGLLYNVNKHTRFEVGYLIAYINPPRNRPNRHFDVLQLSVNYNL